MKQHPQLCKLVFILLDLQLRFKYTSIDASHDGASPHTYGMAIRSAPTLPIFMMLKRK